MKPEAIKIGETYVDERKNERTVVDICHGEYDTNRSFVFVKYKTPSSASKRQIRLTEFANWAKGLKARMPHHTCENKHDHKNSSQCSIRFDPFQLQWFIGIRAHKVKITYCPFCGKKLQTPRMAHMDIDCPKCSGPMLYSKTKDEARYVCLNLNCNAEN